MKKYLYQIIVDDIKEQIKNEDFSLNIPICTEKSICEKYKVSRITAIKALEELYKNDIIYKKRGVGCFVVQKDFQKEKLNLINQIQPEKKVVAFVMPFQVPDGVLVQTIQTLNNILMQNNINLAFFSTDNDLLNEQAVLRKLQKENISAIVYYPFGKVEYTELYYFLSKKIPIIIIDKPITTKQMHYICSDNAKGQYDLTELLIKKGHRKIAYLHSNEKIVPSVQDRIIGYVNALTDNNIDFNENFISLAPISKKGKMKKIITQLMKKGVTAIECNNDEAAFSTYLACQSLNIKIPEQLSLTGFDNSNWATLMGLSLTTMKQDFDKIGKLIASILISELKNEKIQKRQYSLPTVLIERNSTDIVTNVEN